MLGLIIMSLLVRFEKEISIITEFRDNYIKYVFLENKRTLNAEQKRLRIDLRERLNTSNSTVATYVRKTGVPTSIYYSPPPAIGGMAGNIDLFANMFNLHQFEVAPQTLIDSLERAVGKYLEFQRRFRQKAINPLYWVGEIIRVPFRLLAFAGFNSSKIEYSWFGKLYKLTTSIIMLAASVLTVLSLVGVNTKLPFLGNVAENSPSTQVEGTKKSTKEGPAVSGNNQQTDIQREENKQN
jgi:hypothetical protein